MKRGGGNAHWLGAQRTFIYVQCYCRRVVRASVAMKRDAPEHSRGYGFVVFERARDVSRAFAIARVWISRGLSVAREGAVIDGYDANGVAAHLKGAEIELSIDIGIGRGKATVWTCDRSKGYG